MTGMRETLVGRDYAAEIKAALDEAMALAEAADLTLVAACIAEALDALPGPHHLC